MKFSDTTQESESVEAKITLTTKNLIMSTTDSEAPNKIIKMTSSPTVAR